MHKMQSNSSDGARLPWWLILIGLATAYSPMFLNRVAISLGATWDWLYGPPSVLVWNWLVMVLLGVFIIFFERRSFKSIGLVKPSGKDIQWSIIFWGISVAVSGFVHEWIPLPPSPGLDIILALSIPVLMLIILTTSITEEVFYRGYAIERLKELTGSMPVAVAISLSLFLLPHILFFGPHWLLTQGLSVALLYVLYVWRRNLFSCIVMHLLGNLMILFPAFGLD
ncbi:CPBP family intramembrane glutamic endopeptidase [Kineobactrum salinum]|uniref:CPBP family intramembrane metalloprotease n=1 Tax=Kineobactrum salinum TaxID=2708301 RepID=A0A6C0U205_9GAMM|nr:CPBP family intramembrane glutamic endopeptidase [Kineobactrum salinum]QIB66091.1 CPBP family intramembrane metalloprotease [Kineobactrum salinum]